MDKVTKLKRLEELRQTILWCMDLPTPDDLYTDPASFEHNGEYLDLNTYYQNSPSDETITDEIYRHSHEGTCGTFACVAGYHIIRINPEFKHKLELGSHDINALIRRKYGDIGIITYLRDYLDIGVGEHNSLFGTAKHGDLTDRLMYLDTLIEDISNPNHEK